MLIEVSNIRIPVQPGEELPPYVARVLHVPESALQNLRVLRKSLDTRKKRGHSWVFRVAVEIEGGEKCLTLRGVKPYAMPGDRLMPRPGLAFLRPPVVVGCGPAGIFSALGLLEKGYQPLIIERGKGTEERVRDVSQFWRGARLDPESNVLFGEGGAGAFSDGKLTCRTETYYTRSVLRTLVDCGAPDNILVDHKPHLGTDRLRQILPRLRALILKKGGTIRFNARLEDLRISQGRISSILVSDAWIDCDGLFLAIGHSAQDTFQTLLDRGFALEPKPFAVGVRVEHPQEWINTTQYGPQVPLDLLGPAEYFLTHQLPDGRGVYTFCMCPGGSVISCSNRPGQLVLNGMSNSRRSGKFGNSAVVVSVNKPDFGSGHPLSGLIFQSQLESQAFHLGGETGEAPVQRVGDFLATRVSGEKVRFSHRPGYRQVNFAGVFPFWLERGLGEALTVFDRKMPGFVAYGVMGAVESRTSSPVRILRSPDTGEALGIGGVFPVGEGAGYAGGIVSSAADGLRAADRVEESKE